MADFEGNVNLNVETSEIEIKGKFKLTEDELNTVSGGSGGFNDGNNPDVVGQGECPNPQCSFHFSCTNVICERGGSGKFIFLCHACGSEIDVNTIDFGPTAMLNHDYREYLGLPPLY